MEEGSISQVSIIKFVIISIVYLFVTLCVFNMHIAGFLLFFWTNMGV
jgi:hypothetical protein